MIRRRIRRSSLRESMLASKGATDYLSAMAGIDNPLDYAIKPKRAPNKARTCPTEAQEQAALCSWWRLACHGYGLPEFALFAVPSGGKRDVIEAAHMKRTGTRRGIPDLCLAVPVQDFHGCYLEMKRIDGGRVSEDQAEVIAWLRSMHYNVCLCWGWLEAKRVIEAYLARYVKSV